MATTCLVGANLPSYRNSSFVVDPDNRAALAVLVSGDAVPKVHVIKSSESSAACARCETKVLRCGNVTNGESATTNGRDLNGPTTHLVPRDPTNAVGLGPKPFELS
jgi:hypothetical protein